MAKKKNGKKEFKHQQKLSKKLKINSSSRANMESPRTEKTIEELRSNANEEIEKLKSLLPYLSISMKTNQILSGIEKQVIQDETRKIIESIISATEFLINGNQSILQNAISIRYILEALITTELLIREEEYKFILNLAFYPAQIARINSIIDELKEEIKRLDKWTERSNDRFLDMMTQFSENKREDIILDYREYEESLAREFEKEEFNIYSDIETFQYPLPFKIRSEQISTQVIPEFEQRVKELKDKQNLIADNLRKESIIQNLFPNIRNQKSKVFKEIVDKKGKNGGSRSWDSKAADADLSSEYKFMYAYTSNLSHFASYSITTSTLVSFDEEKMLLKRLALYLEKIRRNLKIFSQIDETIETIDFSMFNIIEIE